MRECPACRRFKKSGPYLCPDCWSALPGATRRSLSRLDDRTETRLQEFLQQMETGVPMAAIRVTP